MRRLFRTVSPLSCLSLTGLCVTHQQRNFFWSNNKKKPDENDSRSGGGGDDVDESERIPAHLQRYISAQTAIDDAFVESSLELLRLISELDLSEKEYDALTEVSTMLFGASGHSPSLGEQFDTLFVAMSLPASVNNSELSRVLLVVIDSVMPTPVAELLREGKKVLFALRDDGCRAIFITFIHAMLGEQVEVNAADPKFPVVVDSDGPAADGCNGDVAILLRQVVMAIPQLKSYKSFLELERDAENIALRARLFALISQLCKAFDVEGTGMIHLSDLTDSLRNILASDEEVEALLRGITPDEQGRIRYHQLCLMLTKPRKFTSK